MVKELSTIPADSSQVTTVHSTDHFTIEIFNNFSGYLACIFRFLPYQLPCLLHGSWSQASNKPFHKFNWNIVIILTISSDSQCTFAFPGYLNYWNNTHVQTAKEHPTATHFAFSVLQAFFTTTQCSHRVLVTNYRSMW